MNQQLIYGTHPVLEALNSDTLIDRVYAEKGKSGLDDIRDACRAQDIPLLIVPGF